MAITSLGRENSGARILEDRIIDDTGRVKTGVQIAPAGQRQCPGADGRDAGIGIRASQSHGAIAGFGEFGSFDGLVLAADQTGRNQSDRDRPHRYWKP